MALTKNILRVNLVNGDVRAVKYEDEDDCIVSSRVQVGVVRGSTSRRLLVVMCCDLISLSSLPHRTHRQSSTRFSRVLERTWRWRYPSSAYSWPTQPRRRITGSRLARPWPTLFASISVSPWTTGSECCM